MATPPGRTRRRDRGRGSDRGSALVRDPRARSRRPPRNLGGERACRADGDSAAAPRRDRGRPRARHRRRARRDGRPRPAARPRAGARPTALAARAACACAGLPVGPLRVAELASARVRIGCAGDPRADRPRDARMSAAESLARELKGPVLVLGASGFIGANLLHTLVAARGDVLGTASREPAWRLAGLPSERLITVDLLARGNLASLLDRVQPATVFDCVAYGAYSFEQDVDRMYQTNVVLKQELIEQLLARGTHCYIHAGSSSEYGAQSAAPDEAVAPAPNSHYAVTKGAAAGLVYFAGHHRGLRCASLRLYSVYGPLED